MPALKSMQSKDETQKSTLSLIKCVYIYVCVWIDRQIEKQPNKQEIEKLLSITVKEVQENKSQNCKLGTEMPTPSEEKAVLDVPKQTGHKPDDMEFSG